MRSAPVCVRCGGALHAGESRSWTCDHHGEVEPLQLVSPLDDGTVAAVAARSRVPVWQLSPPPVGWELGGVALAGSDAAPVAVAVAWSGPSPLGGRADLIIVAEEPAVGLGAGYAGLAAVDAGDCVSGPHDEQVEVRGHPVALWACDAAPPDRSVLVGEAGGSWLWLVVWPAVADALLLEHLLLTDARERAVTQPRGTPSSRLLSPGRPPPGPA